MEEKNTKSERPTVSMHSQVTNNRSRNADTLLRDTTVRDNGLDIA